MDVIHINKGHDGNTSNEDNTPEPTKKKSNKKTAKKKVESKEKESKVVKETVNKKEDVKSENSTAGISEEEQAKLDFRLSKEGEKLLDDYIKLLKDTKVDLNNYQEKEDSLKINTLKTLMSKEEIADR